MSANIILSRVVVVEAQQENDVRRELNELMNVLQDEGAQLFGLLARITLSEHVAEELLQQLVLKFVIIVPVIVLVHG